MKRRKIPNKKQPLSQLKQKDLKALRVKYYHLQKGRCPLLGCTYPIEDATLDHCHSTKKDTIGVNGKGLVRGVIHRQANSLEGKITNAFRRLGLHKFGIPLPDFLRNLADFLESPPLDHLQLIHPTEKPKTKKLKKASYNKMQKAYKTLIPKPACPGYPKSGNLTKPMQKAFEAVGMIPEYYK